MSWCDQASLEAHRSSSLAHDEDTSIIAITVFYFACVLLCKIGARQAWPERW